MTCRNVPVLKTSFPYKADACLLIPSPAKSACHHIEGIQGEAN